jgi:capsular exopolysaccharide synthesis family protein
VNQADFERTLFVQQHSEAFNLERALGIARHRLPLIALCAIVVAGAAFGFSKHQTKKYTASASLDFETSSFAQQIAGLQTGGAPNNSTEALAQQASNVERAKSAEAAVKTAKTIGHGLTAGRVLGSLEVAGQGESSIVLVSSTTTSPGLSAAIANGYAAQVVVEERYANFQKYKAALAIVRKQIAALSPAQRVGPDGLELQNRAQSLSLLSQLKVDDVKVASEAAPPASASSPKTSRNTALGGFVGLIIGIGLVLLLERIDRRIRTPEELEAVYRLPLLGSIPRSAALARTGSEKEGVRQAPPVAESEQFNLIRARLRYFNIDRELRTVLVASAEAGDGKSLVALNLAEAAARSGAKTLLLETDLRQPTLMERFSLPAGPGLADVLIGATPPREAIQSIPLDASATLDVLSAGAVLPLNPNELLESDACEQLLHSVRSDYDLVVLDTPPLTVVSDAFALLTKVDGIVVVGRIGGSRRDAAERLHQVLGSSGAALLGVVANFSRSAGASAYSYYRDAGKGTRGSTQNVSDDGALVNGSAANGSPAATMPPPQVKA